MDTFNQRFSSSMNHTGTSNTVLSQLAYAGRQTNVVIVTDSNPNSMTQDSGAPEGKKDLVMQIQAKKVTDEEDEDDERFE